MKGNQFRLKSKIYPILWTGIIVISVYLLIRYAALSFSDNIGQAGTSVKKTILTNLCIEVIESGSSFIRYTANEEKEAYAFPLSLITNEFALQEFVKDNSLITVRAQEYSSLLPDEFSQISEEKKKDSKVEEMQPQGGIRFYNIAEGFLSKEYILSNGATYVDTTSGTVIEDLSVNGNLPANQLQIGYLEGDINYEETEDENNKDSVETVNTGNMTEYTMEQLMDVSFLVRNFYIVDGSTKVTESLFDAEKLLGKDMTMEKDKEVPQILIYHTHSQEAYVDSSANKQADTVVGVGSYLTEILTETYGYNVIHDTTYYDIVDGVEDKSFAYNMAEIGIEKILKENPTIEVVIDLHRDGVQKRSTVIDGEETAQIMLFNGLSRDQNGPLTGLDNPNQEDNLAFSLQLQLKSHDLYPGLFYKNYLKSWRYNMHVRPKCILMELGTHKNTLQSAKNAMEPFAEVLDDVLQGN